jgi:hypothetical protein
MRLLCVLLALLMVVTFFGAGCSGHDRYRQMTYRYAGEADGITIQDDADAYILADRPTHLSQWYFP